MKTRFSLALRMFGVMLAGLFVAATLTTTAYAATYKVRVFAGNEGTVNGKGDFDEISVEEGTNVTLNDEFDVKVTDPSKYYFKGYRVSGKDNRDPGALKDDVVVTEDMDFVIAYGSRGQMTTYTIKFVEQGTGRALTNDDGVTSVTYEGKVGDKPVVAYSYVPGYRPLYRNITGTLKEGANEWSLPYVAVETEVVDEGTTTTTTPGTTTVVTQTGGGGTTTTTGGGTTGGGTTTTGTTTTTTTGGGTEGTTGGNEGTTTTTTTTTTPTTTTTTPTAAPTEEILDVDNPLAAPDQKTETEPTNPDEGKEETPTTPEELEPEEEESGLSPLAAVLGAAGVAALGGLAFFIVKRRQEG